MTIVIVKLFLQVFVLYYIWLNIDPTRVNIMTLVKGLVVYKKRRCPKNITVY